MLTGLRVIELATGTAGPYCGKLLRDAGAQVIKVEPEGGDPFRRWALCGTPVAADSAMFRFLNAGKQSIVSTPEAGQIARLLATADVVIESGQLTDVALAALRTAAPAVHIVSITPFGRTGPWRDRPANEFILQALAGSTGSRGLPGREPVQAGGRLGDYLAGTFAAVVAAALARQREGEHVDLSVLEAMCSTMSMQMPLTASLDGRTPGPERRFTWLPSNHPTTDGFVGLCTATGQMFADFAALIGRPGLAEDPTIRTPERYGELLAIIDAWTSVLSSEEVQELASAFRIPVAPVGSPTSLTEVGHFREREVFHPDDDGVRRPRVPYLFDGKARTPAETAPHLGEHTATASWHLPPRDRTVSTVDGSLPLTGLKVLDLTAFWAGPFATQVLAALGADVLKVESVQRPDGMRFATRRGHSHPEDPWWEWGGLFQASNWNKRDVTLNLNDPRGFAVFLDLVRDHDVVVENFSPRVMPTFGATWERLTEVNPRLVYVRMPAFGLTGPWRDRSGLAQTMEQAAGCAWLTGYADGPPMILKGPCDPVAGLHAAFAALVARDQAMARDSGVHVEVPMVETALNVTAALTIELDAYGVVNERQGNRAPGVLVQGVYPVGPRGDDEWIAVSAEDEPTAKELLGVLGVDCGDDVAELRAMPVTDPARDELDHRITAACRAWRIDDLERELMSREIPAARVTEPERVHTHEQHRARSYLESFEHPLAGTQVTLGMPFRFAGRGTEPWLTSPPPLLGQHTAEALAPYVAEQDIAALTAADVTGTHPVNL